MKKLLIFHPYLAPYRIDLYNTLSNYFNLKVALLGGNAEIATLGYDLDFVNRAAKFDYRYYKKGFRLGRHLISLVYLKLIRSFRPDIVLTHELGLNTLIAILLKRIFKYKIYTTIDDSPAMAKSYGKKRDLLRAFVIKHINGMIVVNPEVKTYLEKKYHNKCRYFYMPIIQDDVLLSRKINDARDLADVYSARYGVRNKNVVLFVGRLEPMKCPGLLVDAFLSVNDENRILVIVGTGSMEAELKRKVKGSNVSNIVLAGRLTGKELYAWYYLANVFVLPSKFEPFGAVVNEALVAGCFTIVTDKVGAASLLNAENGCVIHANDEAELCDALNRSVSYEKTHQSIMTKTFRDYFFELLSFFQK